MVLQANRVPGMYVTNSAGGIYLKLDDFSQSIIRGQYILKVLAINSFMLSKHN